MGFKQSLRTLVLKFLSCGGYVDADDEKRFKAYVVQSDAEFDRYWVASIGSRRAVLDTMTPPPKGFVHFARRHPSRL